MRFGKSSLALVLALGALALSSCVFNAAGGSSVSAPTFSPSSTTFSSSLTVTMSCSTNGAIIYYTTDGTTPTIYTSSYAYSGTTVTITGTTTLKALAYLSGTSSTVTSATYTLQSSITGTVKGYVTTTALSDVTVTAYTTSGSTSAGTATTGSDGSFSLQVPAGNYYLYFTKPGYNPEYYYDVTVDDSTVTYLETLDAIPTTITGSGDVSGIITNAYNGNPVANATLDLYSGINTTTSTIVRTTVTDSVGAYSFAALPTGHYTGKVTLSGSTTATFTVISLGGYITANQNFSLAPSVGAGQVRIVLTWGSSPADLDAHLKTPDGSHIYYSNKGSSTYSPYAALDNDEFAGYGPETITIYTKSTGDYTFYVHDYTNASYSSSYYLANSGATVKVYMGSTLTKTFYVPYQGGTLWKVFKLNGSSITSVNSMLYETSSGTVATRAAGALDSEEARLFSMLPAKK